jgi:hypothetical protein
MSVDSYTLTDLPDRIWNLTQAVGPASVFYQKPLLTLWHQVFGWEHRVYSDDKNLLVGYVKKTLAGSQFFSLPMGWYGGVIGAAGCDDFLASVLARLKGGNHIEESIVQFGEPEPAFSDRYERRKLVTHIVDLNAETKYAANTRRNVNRSRDAGLELVDLTIGREAEVLELLHEHVAVKQKKRKLDDDFYRALLQLTSFDGANIVFAGAEADGRPLACHVYFRSQTDCFYFDGFASDEGMKKLANYYIVDRMIDHCRGQGIKRLNLGASPGGDQGLIRFKEGWGAEAVKYFEYYRSAGLKRALDRMRWGG